jgi:hypothetical protein
LIVQRVRASSYFICLVSCCLSFTDAEQYRQSRKDRAEQDYGWVAKVKDSFTDCFRCFRIFYGLLQVFGFF